MEAEAEWERRRGLEGPTKSTLRQTLPAMKNNERFLWRLMEEMPGKTRRMLFADFFATPHLRENHRRVRAPTQIWMNKEKQHRMMISDTPTIMRKLHA